MTTDTAAAQFDMGRVISRTFEVIRTNLVSFTLLSVLAVVPSATYSWFLERGQAASVSTFFSARGIFITIGSFLLSGVLSALCQATITYGTVMALSGRRASVGQCLAVGVNSILALIGISIVSTLFIIVGFVLLIVPGLIMATMWIVAVPARVVESTGVLDSLSRSGDLTSGHRWSIFGLAVVWVAAAGVADFALRPLTGMPVLAAAQAPGLAFFVGRTVLSVISTLISETGIASIYYELRNIREGIGAEQLAAVFA